MYLTDIPHVSEHNCGKQMEHEHMVLFGSVFMIFPQQTYVFQIFSIIFRSKQLTSYSEGQILMRLFFTLYYSVLKFDLCLW